jgi:hypothetical protein
MADTETTETKKLHTLSEISQHTGISMPTLQRYKKMYQNRIPAEGKGRKQRYPDAALPVFEALKVENAGRRGRPRKDAAAAARPAAGARRGGRGRAAAEKRTTGGRGRGRKAAPAAAVKKPAPARRGGRKAAAGRGAQRSGNLLTLGQVSEQTGISYPTLVRYVRLHSDRLPSEGTGRARRFRPEAVEVFRTLRQESGRGGRKPAAAKASAGRGRGGRAGRGSSAAAARGTEPGLTQRLRSLEKSHLDLEKKFRGIVQSLQKLFR